LAAASPQSFTVFVFNVDLHEKSPCTVRNANAKWCNRRLQVGYDNFAAASFEQVLIVCAVGFVDGRISGERHVPMPGVDFGEFQEGLVEAFDEDELTFLLRVQMNIQLRQILATGSFNAVTFNLTGMG
jgi:hypothetical protein